MPCMRSACINDNRSGTKAPHHVFNENFVLNVPDLNQIDLATEEDRRYEIDRWAQMFKAGTWEELRI